MRLRYGVRPGTSWGTLSLAGQAEWGRLKCDQEDPLLNKERRAEADYLRDYAAKMRDALAARPATRRISGSLLSRKTVVSVCVCTTSRHTQATEVGQLALFSIMLPSLRETLTQSAAAHPGLTTKIDAWLSTVAAVATGHETTAAAAATSAATYAATTAATAAATSAATAGGANGSDGGGVGGDGVDASDSVGADELAAAEESLSDTPEAATSAAAGGGPFGTAAAATAPVGGAASSAAASPSPSTADFEFWLYVLFDAGDAFFDNEAREAEVRAWIDKELVAPLAAVGVTLRFTLLRFENVLRKPGPAFNFMMKAAADDGADYLYRVNDDTQFVGAGWATQAVSALRAFEPPNVGVVGPVCHEGNTRILTHDLVHRTHLDIFEHYYPPIFSDWWMDDWITHVYGPSRTRRGPFLVRHHTGHQGTRYEVDRSHETKLQAELSSGKQQIERWLLSKTP